MYILSYFEVIRTHYAYILNAYTRAGQQVSSRGERGNTRDSIPEYARGRRHKLAGAKSVQSMANTVRDGVYDTWPHHPPLVMTPGGRLSKRGCSITKRGPTLNDTLSESSRRDFSDAGFYFAPALLHPWRYGPWKVGRRGVCDVPP